MMGRLAIIGQAREQGLTLVEMVVVMLIVALAAGLAVRATEGVVAQSRHDATLATLEAIRDAVLGARAQREPDGTLLLTGFVADIGRRPHMSGAQEDTGLEELWSQPAALDAFALRADDETSCDLADATLRVASGWRGPYLQLPPGASRLVDGWGNPFELIGDDGVTPAADGASIRIVRSLGADGAAGLSAGDPYSADLAVDLAPEFATAALSGTLGVLDAAGNAITVAGDDDVRVCAFGPDPQFGTLRAVECAFTRQPSPASYECANGNALTPGVWLLRAHHHADATTFGVGALGSQQLAEMRLVITAGGSIKDVVLRCNPDRAAPTGEPCFAP